MLRVYVDYLFLFALCVLLTKSFTHIPISEKLKENLALLHDNLNLIQLYAFDLFESATWSSQKHHLHTN